MSYKDDYSPKDAGMDFETAKEIELAVAASIGIRSHVIVPNVSWGMLPYEADLLVLTKTGYLWEIEIKTSKADILRDQRKRHKHDSDLVRRLWFAIPEKIERNAEHIPERAGIFVVHKNGHVIEKRPPTTRGLARPLTDTEKFTLVRLGAIRIWALKRKILKLSQP